MRDRDGRDQVAHKKSGDHSAKVPGRKTRPETETREDEKEQSDERTPRAKTNGSLFGGVPWSRDDDKDIDDPEHEREEEEDEEEEGEATAVEAKTDDKDADDEDDGDDDDDGDDGDDGDSDDGVEAAEHEEEEGADELKAKAEGEVSGGDVAKRGGESEEMEEESAETSATKSAKENAPDDESGEQKLAYGDHDSDGATDDVDEESEEEFEAEALGEDGKYVEEAEEGEDEYSEGQAALDEQLEPGGDGQRLDRRIQHRLEQETGFALDGVRVHTGGKTQSTLQQHDALGAAKGRNILLADASQAQDYELMRHEVAHVIQQGSGKVSPKLGNTERAKHESDADRHTHKRHHELKELSLPTTGPAQFRLAYDGPPPTVKKPAPKPRPAPRPRPAPPPPPRYTAPVIQKRTMGSDYVPPTVAARKPKPSKPKPYVLNTTGDQHWNDSNLRGQSVNTKVQRWKEKHSHQQALANRDARKTGGDPPNLMPKLTKQEKKDLAAYRRSERLAQDGALFAKGIREKREAEERRRLEAERKKKESGGFWGGLKKIAKGAGKVAVKATHVGLDVAGYVPGPIGSGASAANAGIYFAEGNEAKGKEKMIEAAVGLIPVPGAKVAGKIVQKAAFKGASKVAAQKAGSKAGSTIISAAARGKRMIYQNRGQIRKAGQDMFSDIAKDQVKALAKDKTNATTEGYDPLKTLRDTFVSKAKGKAAKKLAVKNPRKAALDASAYAKKKVALMPVPEGARKFAEKQASKYAAKLARNTETVAAVGVDQVETQVKAEVERDKKRKAAEKKKRTT